MAPAKQESGAEARNADGTWPEGVSGNPAGPPKGHFKLTYWAAKYVAGDDMSKCPPRALELVEAMHRDAVQRPGFTDKDGNEHPSSGCPATRKILWERLEGPVKQEFEIEVVEHTITRKDVRRDVPIVTDEPEDEAGSDSDDDE